MNRYARIISTHSADVFGVCSALFELRGRTIMHDASGCNSTYTTHDEPRWYDMDSWSTSPPSASWKPSWATMKS